MDKTQTIFKERAKTFYLASIFFSKEKKKDVETLYNFCRYVDDIGDESGTNFLKKKKLKLLKKELKTSKSKNHFVKNFIKLSKIYNIDIRIAYQLIEGVFFDTDIVNIDSLKQLEEYSYKVAGTVGLMMCSIMNINNDTLLKHAVELGVAMQITNICRDVKEDLLINRIYIPKEFRGFNFTSKNDLLYNEEKKKILSENIKLLIEKSNRLYSQSEIGTMKLPFKYRIVILIASRLYKEIGIKIFKDPNIIWKERVFVSFPVKMLIIFLCLLKSIFPLKILNIPKKNTRNTNFYKKYYFNKCKTPKITK